MIESPADPSRTSRPLRPFQSFRPSWPLWHGPGWRPIGRITLLCTAAALLGACAIQPVQPWEKGVLAKPEMSFDNDRLETLLAEHTYASKEAASGGNGVGGGGCGCN